MIDKRPKIVEKKSRIGDWEIDTVIGANHKGVLVTVVDRASKFTLIKKVDSKHAEVVTKAIVEMMQPVKALTHTMNKYQLHLIQTSTLQIHIILGREDLMNTLTV